MHTGLKLTPAIIVTLAEKYRAGKTTTELALEHNMSKATICRALRKAGIEPERKDNLFTPREVTEEQKDAIILDFRAGVPIKNLAKKYECGYTVISSVLEEAGLWSKKKINKPVFQETRVIKVNDNTKKILGEKEKQDLCEKFVDGPYTKQELAEEYQIHTDTVNAILRRNDCQTKKWIPEEVVDQICEDYLDEMPIEELCKTYNRNAELIKYWLTKRGVIDTKDQDPIINLGVPLSASAFRKLCKGDMAEVHQRLMDLIRDPSVNARTQAMCMQILIDRTYGKPREEPEEDREKESTTAQILSLVSKEAKNKIVK